VRNLRIRQNFVGNVQIISREKQQVRKYYFIYVNYIKLSPIYDLEEVMKSPDFNDANLRFVHEENFLLEFILKITVLGRISKKLTIILVKFIFYLI
jgi:hypothetical protein